MIYRSTSQKQRELKHCLRFLRLTKIGKLTELILQVCSEPVKLTEVTDKRLFKATPKGRKILLFADNSNYDIRGARLLRTLDETSAFSLLRLRCYLAGLKALPCRIYKPSKNMR